MFGYLRMRHTEKVCWFDMPTVWLMVFAAAADTVREKHYSMAEK